LKYNPPESEKMMYRFAAKEIGLSPYKRASPMELLIYWVIFLMWRQRSMENH